MLPHAECLHTCYWEKYRKVEEKLDKSKLLVKDYGKCKLECYKQ